MSSPRPRRPHLGGDGSRARPGNPCPVARGKPRPHPAGTVCPQYGPVPGAGRGRHRPARSRRGAAGDPRRSPHPPRRRVPCDSDTSGRHAHRPSRFERAHRNSAHASRDGVWVHRTRRARGGRVRGRTLPRETIAGGRRRIPGDRAFLLELGDVCLAGAAVAGIVRAVSAGDHVGYRSPLPRMGHPRLVRQAGGRVSPHALDLGRLRPGRAPGTGGTGGGRFVRGPRQLPVGRCWELAVAACGAGSR